MDNRLFNVSVIDGKNQYVNAGLSFTRRPDLDLIHVALAKRATEWLSFGTTVKRFTTSKNNVASQGAQISGFEGGLSMGIALPPTVTTLPVQIGLTADNLRHKVQDEQYVGPRQLGGGVKVTFNKKLMLYGDTVENFSNFSGAFPTYSGGAEIAVTDDIYVRGGMFGFVEKGWSAGGGWVGPKIGLSYGYQNRHQGAVRSFDHAVTMDIYM
ncbi:MAG: hypothetical protein HY074_11090 [Deltaproteobacteria bacterium]|nr:hypothetical protein [Deltaproteobacteria bacterium]